MTWRNKLPTLTALLHDRTLRVAVTGLSQSGKTAFITSLVHNLVGTVGRPGRLPFLRAAAEQRILAARVLTSDDDTVGRFPLEQNVAALAAELAPRSPVIGSIFSRGTRRTTPPIRKRPARRMTSTVIFSRPAGNASR